MFLDNFVNFTRLAICKMYENIFVIEIRIFLNLQQ
jgi:hypothetical protein